MPKTASAQARIVGIDVCRSGAIMLAMLSHAFIEFGVFRHHPTDAMFALRFIFQLAPPIFIILFGSMIELVYRQRAQNGDGKYVVHRLLTRALQCYLLYVLTLVAMFVSGEATLGYAIRCALMIGVTPYADILKFYTLALALAPALLLLRNTFGLTWLLVGAGLIHAGYGLFLQLPTPPTIFGGDYLGPIAGFLYGGGGNVGGPSLVHGLAFVIVGMALGKALVAMRSENAAERKQGQRLVMGLLAVTGGVTLVLWDHSAPFQTVREIADMSLRNANHPLYSMLGILATILSVLLCIWLYDDRKIGLGTGIVFMGKTSLFTFGFGNVLLYLSPDFPMGVALSWVFGFGFFALICLQSYVFFKLQVKTQSAAAPGWRHLAAARFQIFLSRVNALVSQLVAMPAQRYSAMLRFR